MPHSTYQPAPNTSAMSSCDRYSHSSRSARSVPYTTQRSSRGVSSSSGSPPPPPPPQSSATAPPSTSSSVFLPLEPASPSMFSTYPSGWQGSTNANYWPANPSSPVGKRIFWYLNFIIWLYFDDFILNSPNGVTNQFGWIARLCFLARLHYTSSVTSVSDQYVSKWPLPTVSKWFSTSAVLICCSPSGICQKSINSWTNLMFATVFAGLSPYTLFTVPSNVRYRTESNNNYQLGLLFVLAWYNRL